MTAAGPAGSSRLHAAGSWVEAVPGAPHGLDELSPELAAQVADVDLDGVRAASRPAASQTWSRISTFVTTRPGLRSRYSRTPNSRGVSATGSPATVTARVAGSRRTSPAASTTGRAAAGARRSRARSAGEQHDVGERLGQVVVGAAVEPVGLVVLAVLGRQHQHRHPVLLGAQRPDDVVARTAAAASRRAAPRRSRSCRASSSPLTRRAATSTVNPSAVSPRRRARASRASSSTTSSRMRSAWHARLRRPTGSQRSHSDAAAC